jgi:hypothetical protein
VGIKKMVSNALLLVVAHVRGGDDRSKYKIVAFVAGAGRHAAAAVGGGGGGAEGKKKERGVLLMGGRS